jgi:hypothetical protein
MAWKLSLALHDGGLPAHHLILWKQVSSHLETLQPEEKAIR